MAVVPVHKEKHTETTVANSTNFSYAEKEHLIPVVAHEFSRLAAEWPIVFVKDNNTGGFVAVALMGLKAGENLFCGKDKWPATWVPSALTNYPFSLAKVDEKGDQMVLCLNDESDLVNTDNGEKLFDESGEETEYLKQRKAGVIQYAEQTHATEVFVKTLTEKDLLIPQTLTLNPKSEEPVKIDGIYIINEEKLNGLSAEDFQLLRDRQYLPAIYAQLFSLQQVNRLLKLRADQAG